MLTIKNLSKKYPNGYEAIKAPGLSFSIEPNEFVVLVGPSGCGKSTLLRMISGLESITAGSIDHDGFRMDDKDPAKRKIAMVFQNYALYPHMSCYQNMMFGLKNLKVPKAEAHERIVRTAKMLDVEHLLERKPAMLSGGQRQRIAIGRAIVKKPNIFLFDEPLSNLDAQLRNHMRMEIKKLHKQLNAISIYVTHDQTEAMTLADKLVVLNKGEIEQIGTPQEVFENPNTLFVAKFIGTSPLNQLSADDIPVSKLGGQILDETRTLAIRSEDICFEPDSAREPYLVLENGKLEEQEILGTDSLYHYDFSGLQVTAKGSTNRPQNDSQTLYLPWRKIIQFNDKGESLNEVKKSPGNSPKLRLHTSSAA
ncbi:ATP-binding cassette domain-containing protein [Vibrio sp. S4M6]|uniref:ABC transporter ATP-binding protein n=1 Tax=Vibrio sinus TaxID=2946865 RepID=UPI00202AB1F3|nr:ATP-binding cassette domain-containing protein [Vibrio sinus]MCL9780943.1 ATP-binding cassette domain-containing protein [Vibrio sinus]